MKHPKSPPSRKNSHLPFIETTGKGVFIRIRLQPRSSKNTIDGVQEGSLRIRLTAPPVENEANRAVIEFLSDILGIRKSSLEIYSGHKSRDKRVKVEGMTLEAIEAAFAGKV